MRAWRVSKRHDYIDWSVVDRVLSQSHKRYLAQIPSLDVIGLLKQHNQVVGRLQDLHGSQSSSFILRQHDDPLTSVGM